MRRQREAREIFLDYFRENSFCFDWLVGASEAGVTPPPPSLECTIVCRDQIPR